MQSATDKPCKQCGGERFIHYAYHAEGEQPDLTHGQVGRVSMPCPACNAGPTIEKPEPNGKRSPSRQTP